MATEEYTKTLINNTIATMIANGSIGDQAGVLQALAVLFETTNASVEDYFGKMDKAANATDELTEALEREKAALEQTRDELKRTTEILYEAITARLEKELEETTNAVEAYFDGVGEAFDELIENAREELDKLQEASDEAAKIAEKNNDALTEQAEAVQEYYDSQIEVIDAKIEALKGEGEATEKLLKLQEARDKYEKAKQRTRLVLTDGGGWRFKTDTVALEEASAELASAETEHQIDLLERQKEKLTSIKDSWAEIAENIGKSTSELNKAAGMQAFLSGLTQGDLQNLQSQFRTQVGQNNILNENALLAKNNLERQSDSSIMGTIAWLIDQWERGKEQAEDQRHRYQIATDPQAAAVENIKNSVMGELADPANIEGFFEANEKFLTESAEKINSINDALESLEEIMEHIDLTEEELQKLQEIENEVNGATLKSLLRGGSLYNQVETNAGEIIKSNGDIAGIDKEIELTTGAINANASGIRDGVNSIKNSVQGSHAAGGLVSNTGLTVVHGTQTHPEMMLNANHAAKLFDWIDGLPNRINERGYVPSFGNASGGSTSSVENATFRNCNFNIKTDADNVDKLVRDIKRKAPF